MKERVVTWILAVALIVTGGFTARQAAAYAAGKENGNAKTAAAPQQEICVVLDAGHGGEDPGKIGINNALEKDINLAITGKVKTYLEAQGIRVILTREDEGGLYEEGDFGKKIRDMEKRISVIEEARPALAVSIHQNSYPRESIHGAQVFYYKDSPQGQKLAAALQQNLIRLADPDNKRTEKANDSYYLLKRSSVPLVIAECGFLSNAREAEKLCSDAYQDRVAWAIHMGILQYLAENEG